MNIKVKANLSAGIICIILSVILWLLIPSQIVLSSADRGIVDAQFMPKFMAIVMFISGIILLIQSKVKEDKYIEFNVPNELKALLYIGILIIYAILLSKTSFIIASAFLGVMTLVLLGCKNKKYYGIILILVIILKVIFQYILNVPLP